MRKPTRATRPRYHGDRRLLIISGLVALLVTAGLFVGIDALGSSPASSPKLEISATDLHNGEQVPLSFRLARLGGGKAVELSSLAKGKPLVMNVFASDCPACAGELRAFAKVARNERATVAFVGIDTNDPDPSRALQLLQRAGATYPVGIDTPRLAVASALGIANLPTTLFISPSGKLEQAVLGEMTTARLQSAVHALTH